MFFSVGFATRDDFEGAWMTLESLLLHHAETVDQIVIVDNSPKGSKHASLLSNHVKTVDKVKYVRGSDEPSSCLPKNQVFTESDCEFAACCDSHVIFSERSLRAVREFWQCAPSDTRDIVSGPCWVSAGRNRCMGTQQMIYQHEGYQVKAKPPDYQRMAAWRGGALGVWVNDDRARDPANDPFPIRQQGTGFFSMRRDAWVGFHPEMKGHGGNETYMYEKVRRAGGTAWCIPAAAWVHRFGRIQTPYAVNWHDRARNYIVGFRDLGRPDLETGVIEHLRSQCPSTVGETIERLGPTPNPRKEWCDALNIKSGGVCPEGIADAIRQLSRPGMLTLELGSGYSTTVFDQMKTDHTAVEHSRRWIDKVRELVSDRTRVVHYHLDDAKRFPSDPPALLYPHGRDRYKLILIDGPPNLDGANHRHNAIPIIAKLADKNASIIVDDTHRPGDEALACQLADLRGLTRHQFSAGNRKFEVLTPNPGS